MHELRKRVCERLVKPRAAVLRQAARNDIPKRRVQSKSVATRTATDAARDVHVFEAQHTPLAVQLRKENEETGTTAELACCGGTPGGCKR